MSLRKLLFPVLAAFAAISMASSVKADLMLYVIADGTVVGQFAAGGDGTLTVSQDELSDLNDSLASEGIGIAFNSLAGTSDAPNSGTTALLTVDFNARSFGTGGTLTVVAADNDFFLPAGPGTVLSKATANFTTTNGDIAETSADFTSYFDETNSAPSPTPAGMETAVLTYGFPGGFDQNLTGVTIPGSFGLSNETVFTLGDAIQTLQFTGNTQVTSVIPEPASMTMLAMGGLGLVGMARRRKAQV